MFKYTLFSTGFSTLTELEYKKKNHNTNVDVKSEFLM